MFVLLVFALMVLELVLCVETLIDATFEATDTLNGAGDARLGELAWPGWRAAGMRLRMEGGGLRPRISQRLPAASWCFAASSQQQ